MTSQLCANNDEIESLHVVELWSCVRGGETAEHRAELGEESSVISLTSQ